MIAVISDIHANYDALKAVLDEIDRLGPEAIICLGDVVGYGPQPTACVDEVRKRCHMTLCGNHDAALVYGADDFNPVARASIEYHRHLLMPRANSATNRPDRQERWQFLKGLPRRQVRGESLFVHASPRNPVSEYLRKIDVLLGLGTKLSENFEQVDWLCFIGHTHRPGIITQDMRFIDPDDIGGVYQPERRTKAIINVGSVGQPRDGDWRACFVTVHEDSVVRYHRTEYDVDATVEKVAAAPGIDHSLADRLRRGK
jgi:diadenosine tetraphosphatase ApaH/serine/threonine PP2A family protein phosphatase